MTLNGRHGIGKPSINIRPPAWRGWIVVDTAISSIDRKSRSIEEIAQKYRTISRFPGRRPMRFLPTAGLYAVRVLRRLMVMNYFSKLATSDRRPGRRRHGIKSDAQYE
jgi:hypothetical protein